MSIYELYVEKKEKYASEAAFLAADLRQILKINNITAVRLINRYFAGNITEKDFENAKTTVFSEPPVDNIYDKLPSFDDLPGKSRFFVMEFLPGQFDFYADSCSECIMLFTGKEKPIIQYSRIVVIYGDITDSDFFRIKSWLINPVESRETSLEIPSVLIHKYPEPGDISILDGFISLSDDGLLNLQKNMNLAMDLSDLKFCQEYFRDSEKRNPSITEIRVLDTYWSDHCRHTTFLTELKEIQIDDKDIRESYEKYLSLRESGGRKNKPVTLMDIATIGAKTLKNKGLLNSLDESEEINACSVKIKVDVNGKNKDWLLMFKNETHNHPTEIEPFGGAATCLGGAIRDPLSGRAYVYQAMRITGAADPLKDAALTLQGKLPQIKICRTAAAGYSSYGNHIGAATGLVHEIYHPGYAAKRMELGAVIAAAPAENVVRKTPTPGDVVILLGGRTGRDGIGAAAGSSKSHTISSLETCGADVQKGNPPEERKIVRLFRNPSVTKLIKKCNDFGAGGVSVSVGELADGLEIDLNKVSQKYEGLNGTEIAISESQERMSIVIAKKDIKAFFALAAEESLEAEVIAEVTKEKRLKMNWNGKTIVNISREFLNSNGAGKSAKVHIKENHEIEKLKNSETVYNSLNIYENFIGSLNICSQKGLINGFDSSIGASTAVAPLGGKYQLTPAQSMAAKIPVLNGDTHTCSLMSWGFDPVLSSVSPYHGAIFSVVHSIAKIIAAGGNRKKSWLTFQEYFERLRDDPVRWGKPFSALLGALDAQIGLEIAAIGGKDSMSGSFSVSDTENIDVPPTLVSFAVSTVKLDNIITPEFKKPDSFVYLLNLPFSMYEKIDYSKLADFFDTIEKLNAEGKVKSCWALGNGGTAEAVLKMCMGNRIGFKTEKDLYSDKGFSGFIIETYEALSNDVLSFKTASIELYGRTTAEFSLITKSFNVSLDKLQKIWENTLEPVYANLINQDGKTELLKSGSETVKLPLSSFKTKKPEFLIPVFPGTNSEYDAVKAIEKAGGKAKVFVVQNLSPLQITESIKRFEKALKNTQVLFFPGGYSFAGEPAGSGKNTAAFIRNPLISSAVMELLQKRGGLIGGTGSGFQALLKLGLVPYGEIINMTETSPTLTINTIGRYQCTLVNTKIVSNKSPWLSHLETGSVYIVPVSHGEGRFVSDESVIRSLANNGQIASQYTDFEGNVSQDIRFNPNNSDFAVEGITSPDGRVFGRMAFNERYENGLFRNIPNISKMDIFSGAVKYFR